MFFILVKKNRKFGEKKAWSHRRNSKELYNSLDFISFNISISTQLLTCGLDGKIASFHQMRDLHSQ